jgi:5-deoxy-D-glucuronate isomerase
MSYPWCNEVKLDVLHASGSDGKLVYKTANETVEVLLDGADIRRVVWRSGSEETIIEGSDAHHIVVGEGNAQRDVYHYLKPGGPAPQLRLGITKHRGAGTWSSLPHAFELNHELGFEEVFFYVLVGERQRAIQVGDGVWYDGTAVNAAWLVRDHSFGTIPMGYHPVVGEPGVSVQYIWAYLAKKPSWEKI